MRRRLVISLSAATGLLEAIGWRHHHATFRAQPAEIIDSVMGDDADVGCDQILEPAIDPVGIEIVGVGMAQGYVDRMHLAVRTPGDADAGNMTAAPRPGRSTIGLQALVFRFGVECDDADTAQVRQLARG